MRFQNPAVWGCTRGIWNVRLRSFRRFSFLGRQRPSAAALSSWNMLMRSVASRTAASSCSSSTLSFPWTAWTMNGVFYKKIRLSWLHPYMLYHMESSLGNEHIMSGYLWIMWLAQSSLANQRLQLIVASLQLGCVLFHGLALDSGIFPRI